MILSNAFCFWLIDWLRRRQGRGKIFVVARPAHVCLGTGQRGLEPRCLRSGNQSRATFTRTLDLLPKLMSRIEFFVHRESPPVLQTYCSKMNMNEWMNKPVNGRKDKEPFFLFFDSVFRICDLCCVHVAGFPGFCVEDTSWEIGFYFPIIYNLRSALLCVNIMCLSRGYFRAGTNFRSTPVDPAL